MPSGLHSPSTPALDRDADSSTTTAIHRTPAEYQSKQQPDESYPPRTLTTTPKTQKKPGNAWVFLFVAGAGFEPATFGL